jgi:integrase
MKWSQIDRAAGEVRLWDTKNGEPRVLPLEGELAEIFERRWKAREWKDADNMTRISPLVFHFEGREVGDFRKAWRAACLRAGVVGKKPFHDFRRSAARNMIRAGTPQRVVQQITAHKTAAMFDRYNIVSTDDMRRAGSREQGRGHGARWARTGVNKVSPPSPRAERKRS